MAEDELSITGWDAQVFKNRRGGVAQVVKLDSSEAVLGADSVEGLCQLVRLDGVTRRGCEDEVSIRLACVAGSVFRQLLGDGGEQWQISSPSTSFERSYVDRTACTDYLLADAYDRRFYVNVASS